MAERHGVYIQEVATALTPPIEATAGLPIVFGTAPVHRTEDPAGAVNTLKICYRWSTMINELGYDDDWKKWTCCEVMYSQAKLYNVSPTCFVNVFNPTKHFTVSEAQVYTFAKGKITLDSLDIIADTIAIVKDTDDSYVLGVDYQLYRDEDGYIVVTLIDGGDLVADQTVAINYHLADPSKVTKTDIISAIELANRCYPQFGLTPGFLIAPGWSHDSEVGNVLEAQAALINNHWGAMAVLDVSTKECRKFTDAIPWKSDKGYVSTYDIVGWPMGSMGGRVYHLSTHAVGVAITTDAQYDNIPSASPSNHPLQLDGMCLADGTPVALAPDEAELLNAAGIVTGFRLGLEGWQLFGNRTGAYPGTSDPKDAFIAIRRMYNWLRNTLTLTFWKKLDTRMGRALIDDVVTSANTHIAGWARDGHLIGGRMVYDPAENSVTDLMNGIITFYGFYTPPPPAQQIKFKMQFDTDYLKKIAG